MRGYSLKVQIILIYKWYYQKLSVLSEDNLNEQFSIFHFNSYHLINNELQVCIGILHVLIYLPTSLTNYSSN